MPTGYTHNIKDGITFEKFVWQCARSFGALVTMRDYPADAPIPQKFEVDDYYVKLLDDAKAARDRLLTLSNDEAQRELDAEYEAAQKHRAEYTQSQNEQKAAYEAMLAQVNEWTPPTPDHCELKAFMVQQITESIRWDCDLLYTEENNKPKPELSVWLAKKRASAAENVVRCLKSLAEESERIASRNAWMDALRKSL